jgi:hypothetical protein
MPKSEAVATGVADMMIWVEVQPPNRPNKAMYVGVQPDNLTAKEVAQRVGVPDGCFLDGKIITSRDGERRCVSSTMSLSDTRYPFAAGPPGPHRKFV